MKREKPELVHFVSLGCDKNLVDSEVMLARLWDKGYRFTDDEEAADIAVVNTCCFVHDAQMESIETIIKLGKLKESSRCRALVVAGCLAERYRNEINNELPEVDALVGVNAISAIITAVMEKSETGCRHYFPDTGDINDEETPKRIITTGGYYTYLKIAEGCNKHCTFCIIPKIRGHYRSRTMESLLTESVNLVAGGVKELILVAQETTIYGTDIHGQKMLPQLLRKLCEIEGLKWIRLLYCYPEEIDDDLIAAIRDEEKICKYLDIPIQHGADRILKQMGRQTDREAINNLVMKLRQEVPGICLRTTLMTGFPGEKVSEHRVNLGLVKELCFDRLGVFAYSAEADTPAARFHGQVSNRVKEYRRKQLMKAQQKVAFNINKSLIDRKMTVFVEGTLNPEHESPPLPFVPMEDEKIYVARTYRDAPQIDGYLFFPSNREYESGDFAEVTVIAAQGYDLIGKELT
ncbi:MAG: 30S ribosomal protein S12 methylthiotransferase RimO [Lachnospiraceae bacterium]|jgi:ribosomal protein S12 methylthiotransferase|nr:30S ribosomal protein S12 methylthiotransferase RimO [Lachnospiraceae bacterium]